MKIKIKSLAGKDVATISGTISFTLDGTAVVTKEEYDALVPHEGLEVIEEDKPKKAPAKKTTKKATTKEED